MNCDDLVDYFGYQSLWSFIPVFQIQAWIGSFYLSSLLKFLEFSIESRCLSFIFYFLDYSWSGWFRWTGISTETLWGSPSFDCSRLDTASVDFVGARSNWRALCWCIDCSFLRIWMCLLLMASTLFRGWSSLGLSGIESCIGVCLWT